MPTIKRWADDLRTVFGHDEMNEAMRMYGYMAEEGGRLIDTRPRRELRAVTPALPITKPPHPTREVQRNTRYSQ